MLLRTRPVAARRSTVQSVADRLTPAHLAVARAGAGTALLVRPRALPQALGVDSATATRMAWAVQMLGARDLALGLGALVTLRRPELAASRLWVAGGVLSDAVDALAVAGALGKGRLAKGPGLAMLGVAAGAVALGLRALQDDEITRL